MDAFSTTASEMRIHTTFVIGATFGIFLTIGDVWSSFIKTVVTVIMPDHNGSSEVLGGFIYASFTSVLCLALLICLVKADKYIQTIRINPQKTVPRLRRTR